MKMITILLAAIFLFLSSTYAADSTLVGYSTDGTIYQVDTKTGALTTVASEQITSFTLGATARNKEALYYIAAPSGTSENALYKVDLKTGAISKVDLDKSAGDDDGKLLFFKGKKLYAILSNTTTGHSGLYQINSTTGVTKLILDLAGLNIEPVGGAFARSGKTFFTIVKPAGDSTKRQLLSFKTKANSAKLVDIVDAANLPILCDKIKPNGLSGAFVCLASPSETQVSVCKLAKSGKAKCSSPLSNVLRVAGGHTMMSPNGKKYFAFVYAPDDQNSQRLIQFNAKGVVKNTATVNSIIVGARFGKEDEETPQKQ